ncbi:acyl-coenzyme A thioesterase 5-like [Heterocephalus glaber]|uniref:Acyl-coenzyme A thioesterase 5-like n=1 Tax=Heterocephalus glaber TaxID=10181 RepID=A0AAX6NUT3_HETGA|nr:acyl-coenzyme A thioesterase 5-like [Heterocephalus glaber]
MTLLAAAVSLRGHLFRSLAHYEADGRGAQDLARDPALGGDFTGVRSMELLWSLTPAGPEESCLRQMPRGVMRSPLKVEVTVHSTPRQPREPLGRRWTLRRFSTPERHPTRLKAVHLRAVFLLPPGDGPFPSLICLVLED